MRETAASGRGSLARWTLVLLLGWWTALPAPPVSADDLCGATILTKMILDHDLTCPGDGLIVGADRVTINLNGHTIAGSGVGVGINVTGRTRAGVVGGVIRQFATGIRVNASTQTIVKGVAFHQNVDGVDCQAGCAGTTIKGNAFWDNTSRGIMMRGDTNDNVVKDNSFTRNRVGILLFGAVDTTVQDNIVSASLLAGIRVNVFASGNLIRENSVVSNPAGIEFLVTPTGSAIGNWVLENSLEANGCGLKGPLAGNTVAENQFVGNTADSCL